jgi:hypothetical protein
MARSRFRIRADSACCETPSTAAAAAIDPCLPTSRSARSAPSSCTASFTVTARTGSLKPLLQG